MRNFILIVDDDPTSILLVAIQLLEATIRPYHIVIATSATEALQILNSIGGQVKIVITDYMMPIVDGLELAEKCKSLYPVIKVVLLTAMLPANIENLYLHMTKPFDKQDVTKLLETTRHDNINNIFKELDIIKDMLVT